MALHFCVAFVPEIAAGAVQIKALAPEKACLPQISEVLTGVAKRTPALIMIDGVIGFISDDFKFFMRVAFLLIAVHNDGAYRNTRTPDHVGAPNHI
jgi:hypothetical protein